MYFQITPDMGINSKDFAKDTLNNIKIFYNCLLDVCILPNTVEAAIKGFLAFCPKREISKNNPQIATNVEIINAYVRSDKYQLKEEYEDMLKKMRLTQLN